MLCYCLFFVVVIVVVVVAVVVVLGVSVEFAIVLLNLLVFVFINLFVYLFCWSLLILSYIRNFTCVSVPLLLNLRNTRVVLHNYVIVHDFEFFRKDILSETPFYGYS